MKSRLLLNILMLLIFSALIFFTLFFTADDNTGQALTSLKPDDINEIFIPREKGNIELQKINGTWQMLSPYPMPAHDFRIQHLLKLTQLNSNKVYAADQLELDTFKLKTPRVRIRFNQTWIDFGSTNPVTEQRYIKSGNTVILADDDSYALINSQPSSFVNLSLLPEDSKIQSIKLPQQQLQLKDNRWQLTPALEISADDIQRFLQDWQSAQAFGVHAYLKRKQLGYIVIQLKDKSISFEISDKSPWLILARPELGIEYHLNDNMVSKLLQLKPHTDDTSSQDSDKP